MRYIGGKSRLVKGIATAILDDTDLRGEYLEPFMGGGAMFGKMASHFAKPVGSDMHEDLMMMWQAVSDGWEPPQIITEAEYAELKNADPSPVRALAGFGGSFGGKWFGGYARGGMTAAGEPRNYLSESARAVIRIRSSFEKSLPSFQRADYRDWAPNEGEVIYCDPPYANSQGYSTGGFDSAEFWSLMNDWVQAGASVYVSEYSAPAGWECIWEQTHRVSLKRSTQGRSRQVTTERLFTKRLTPLAVAA